MRPEEIRELGDTDIDQQIDELSNQLFELRMRGTYEELENPMQIRLLRRDIARLKTIRRERQTAERAAGEN
jgi:large subunit ribosomal protein L29